MPTKPARVCSRCHQPATGVCACRPPWQGSQHPGNTTRWARLRASHLRAYPICQWAGCLTLAIQVDHIITLAEGSDRYDRNNLQSLCDHHHRIKTTADALRGKQRPR